MNSSVLKDIVGLELMCCACAKKYRERTTLLKFRGASSRLKLGDGRGSHSHC